MHRLVIALTTFIGLTAATYLAAYVFLFGAASDRAATLVPADVAAYVNAYLEPSTGQQMNLSRLIGQLPGFADEAAMDEKIDQLVQNVMAQTGVDYRADVKPWLGGQAAVATWFETSDAAPVQRTLVVAAVRNEALATERLDRVVAGDATVVEESYGGSSIRAGDAGAYALVDGMAVIGDSVEAVRAAIDASGDEPSLAERPEFRDALTSLPSDHLASAFVDLSAAAAVTGADPSAAVTSGPDAAAAVLLAERDGLRLIGNAPVPRASTTASPAPAVAAATLAGWVPESSVAYAAVFDLAAILADAEAAASGTPGGEQVTDALDTLRAVAAFGLGINLDDDVLPLLAGEVALAFSGVDGTTPRGQLLLRPSDTTAGVAALDRIAERVAEAGGDRATETIGDTEVAVVTIPQIGQLAYAEVEGVLVLGLAADDVAAVADARANGTTLSASDAYRSAFEVAGDRAGHEAYGDVTALAELLGFAAALPSDGRDILSELGSFALVVEPAGDRIEFRAALTLDEGRAD